MEEVIWEVKNWLKLIFVEIPKKNSFFLIVCAVYKLLLSKF